MPRLQDKKQDGNTMQNQAITDNFPGPKVSLPDFIVAAYGLDANELRYNILGGLSPLPPDAHEMYLSLPKQVKISPDGLMGNKATLGMEQCRNLSDRDTKLNWKFSVISYLEAINNINYKAPKSKFKAYYQRFIAYSIEAHLASFMLLLFFLSAALFFAGFIILYVENASITGGLSVFQHTRALFAGGIISTCCSYIFLWKSGISCVESPRKKKTYTPMVNLDEIRLWIISESLKLANPNAEILKIISSAKKLASKETYKNGIQIIDGLTSEIDQLKITITSLQEENSKLRDDLTQKEHHNNNINKQLNNAITSNAQLEQHINSLASQLEIATTKENYKITIETRNTLFAMTYLFCDRILKWRNEETKGTNSTYDAVRWIATQLHKCMDKKLKGYSLNGILGIIKRETVRVAGMKIDPTIVHPSYDGSCHKQWKISDKSSN
jgi:uncharacterized protein YoxC